MMTLMQSKRDQWVTDKGLMGRFLVVKTGKYYGLTQKQINEARKRFNDGEITFEEAKWWLSLKYMTPSIVILIPIEIGGDR